MNLLSDFERADLKWKQRTIRASKFLKAEQQLGFNQFMAAGGKRFDWPGWEIICGPKPGLKKKPTVRVSISSRRKMA